MHIIQAFVSTDNAEEVQIKGRTCRQDNPGSFRRIVFQPDIHGSGLRASCDPTDDANLEQARLHYYKREATEHAQQIQNARDTHRRSAEFIRDMYCGHNEDACVEYLLNAM